MLYEIVVTLIAAVVPWYLGYFGVSWVIRWCEHKAKGDAP